MGYISRRMLRMETPAGSDAVTTVTGYRGRSVQIKCHYESGYEKNNKYLCRGECPPWPATKNISVRSGSPAEDTRFSLYDNTTAKIFTVTITDLRTEDANTYWCVVQQTGPNIYTELQLLVEIANLLNDAKDPTIASAPQKYPNSTIIIGVSVVLVLLLVALLIAVAVQKKKKTRGSLKQNRLLKTVSKKELEKALGKWFTNAGDREAGSDAVTTVTGYRGRSVQIKCHYESKSKMKNKYLCRGKCPYWPAIKDIPVQSGSPAEDTRFSLYDNTTAKIFTVTITDLKAEDANTYWCVVQQTGIDIYTELQLLVVANLLNDAEDPTIASAPQKYPNSTIIIGVSVVLVLLLLALLIAVAVQKKKKTRAPCPEQFPNSSSNLNMVPCPVYENEDNSSIFYSLYSTVQLPSAPSEIYSNTGLPTIPSDPSSPVYAAVTHPGHQDVYSTAQLPCDSSVSAAQSSDIKSGDSIKYATVSFDTSSNGAAPKLISKNQNISCDYDSVTITE
ncbi:CMRF35-like molecule 3 [Silurus asotus]|uniref:CMRF35-like molecule 3 n=1 Tax=Silurus asotus TaxID=30991 RepID=A0AAD5FPR5_SILAS|nr:CMRF35-like molecule 3 [Silurus asotus]